MTGLRIGHLWRLSALSAIAGTGDSWACGGSPPAGPARAYHQHVNPPSLENSICRIPQRQAISTLRAPIK